MRHRNVALLAAFAVTLAAGVLIGWVGNGMAAGEALPGSEQDPLVSRSYVDARLDEFLAGLEPRDKMVVVQVPAGQKLVGQAGTEIIVRAGTATVVDSELGGLADVTEGRDLRKGETAPANHMLIVPRDDGRGILAVTTVTVMVRGAYSVE